MEAYSDYGDTPHTAIEYARKKLSSFYVPCAHVDGVFPDICSFCEMVSQDKGLTAAFEQIDQKKAYAAQLQTRAEVQSVQYALIPDSLSRLHADDFAADDGSDAPSLVENVKFVTRFEDIAEAFSNKHMIVEGKRKAREFANFVQSKVGKTAEELRSTKIGRQDIRSHILAFEEKVATEADQWISDTLYALACGLQSLRKRIDAINPAFTPFQKRYLAIVEADPSYLWHTTGYRSNVPDLENLFSYSLAELISLCKKNSHGKSSVELSNQENFAHAHAEHMVHKNQVVRDFLGKKGKFEFCSCEDQMHKVIFDVSEGGEVPMRFVTRSVCKTCVIAFAREFGRSPTTAVSRFRAAMSKAMVIEKAAKTMTCYSKKPKIARRMAWEAYVPLVQHTVAQQNSVEDHPTPYDALDVSGYLYLVRECMSTRQKPEVFDLSAEDYKKGVTLLEKMLHKNGLVGTGQGGIGDFITRIGDIMDGFRAYGSAKALLATIPDNHAIAAGIVGFIADIVAAANLEGNALIAWAALKTTSYVVMLAGYGIINKTHIASCFTYLTKLIKGEKKGEAHGENVGDDPSIVDVFRVLGHIIFGIGDAKIEVDRAKALQSKFSAFNSFATFIKHLKEFIADIMDWASNMLLGIPMFSSLDERDLNELKMSLVFMNNETRHIEDEMTPERARDILEKHVRYVELREKLVLTTGYAAKFRTWLTDFDKFTKLAERCDEYLNSLVRVQPIGIFAHGTFGVGKSTLVKDISELMFAYEHQRSSHGTKTVYVHPLGETFFEQYFPCVTMTFDEVYATKDAEANAKFSEMLLTALSSAPWPLPMAFEQKGKVHAEPMIIWLTANDKSFPFSRCALYHPQALARRITLDVDFVPDAHYDVKTSKWNGVTDIASHITFVVRRHVISGTEVIHTPAENMNFTQFMELLYSLRDDNVRKMKLVEENKAQRVRIAAVLGRKTHPLAVSSEQIRAIFPDIDEAEGEMLGSWSRSNTQTKKEPNVFYRAVASVPALFSGWSSSVSDQEVNAFLAVAEPAELVVLKSIANALSVSFNKMLMKKEGKIQLNTDVVLAHIPASMRSDWTLHGIDDELYMWTRYGLHSVQFEEAWKQNGGMKSYIMELSKIMASDVWKFLKEWGLVILAAIGTITALLLFLLYPQMSDGEAGYYEIGVIKPKRVLVGVGQMGDTTAIEQLGAVYSDYGSFLLTGMVDGVPVEYRNKFFGIRAEARITNRHFFDLVNMPVIKQKKLFIDQAGVLKEVPLDAVKAYPWVRDGFSLDLCTVVITTKYLAPAHDNFSKFLKKAEIDERVLSNVYDAVPLFSKGVMVAKSHGHGTLYSSVNGNVNVHGPMTITGPYGLRIPNNEFIVYESESSAGHCMNLTVLDNPKSQHKFIGFHGAGVSRGAVTIIVTQEDLEEFVVKPLSAHGECIGLSQGAVFRLRPFEPLKLEPGLSDRHPQAVMPLGHLSVDDHDLANFPPGKTKIVRTRLFPGCVLDRMPANLSGKISWDNVMEKDSTNLSPVPSKFADFVHSVRSNVWSALAYNCKFKGVYSLREAINAPLVFRRMTPLRYATSAGYGLRVPAIPGKSAYMVPSENPEKGFYEPSPEYSRCVSAWLDWVTNKNEVPIVPYTIVLKDELRTIEKVNFPRLFRGESCLISVLGRMFFAAFIETFYENPIKLHHAVGANMNGPYGAYLDKMTNGKKILDTDIKRNDTTQWKEKQFRFWTRAIAFMSAVDDQEKCNGEEKAKRLKIRWALALQVMNNVDSAWNSFWMNSTKIPSGTIMTTISNCEMNVTEAQETALIILEKTDPERFNNIMHKPALLNDWFVVFYGDDGYYDTLNVPSETWIAVGQETHKRVLQDPRKDRKDTQQAVMLSRYTKKIDGATHWCLFESTIEAIPLWYEKSIIPMDHMEPLLCDAALMEWFHHGYDVFIAQKKRYDAELLRIGNNVTSVTYAKCLEDWLRG